MKWRPLMRDGCLPLSRASASSRQTPSTYIILGAHKCPLCSCLCLWLNAPLLPFCSSDKPSLFSDVHLCEKCFGFHKWDRCLCTNVHPNALAGVQMSPPCMTNFATACFLTRSNTQTKTVCSDENTRWVDKLSSRAAMFPRQYLALSGSFTILRAKQMWFGACN